MRRRKMTNRRQKSSQTRRRCHAFGIDHFEYVHKNIYRFEKQSIE